MSFDLCDIFDVASMYRLAWVCDDCGDHMGFESPLRPSLGYYHAQAEAARNLGWHAADISSETVVDYEMLCPACARKKRVPAKPRAPSPPPKDVMIVAELAALPEESQALVAQIEEIRRRAAD